MFLGGKKLKKKYVLDAGILALYFAGDERAKKYIDEVYEGKAEAFMCEVNVAEFLYNYAKVFGWEAALVKHSLLRTSPIKIASIDEHLTIVAAKLKLKHYRVLSLADCYLIALAKTQGATVVTTDRNVKEAEEASTILLTVSR
ncbi:MAG: DNA-binding protein [Thermoprotei archaeon]|nr:MAG: DNA-binding protein [Thermoprotei archaeon]